MAVKELFIQLSTGIQKVFRQGTELKFSNLHLQALKKTIELRIRPLPQKKGQEPLVAVLISETRRPEGETREGQVIDYDLSKEAEQRLHDLEQELQFTSENLQATIEELETSNEELQATNEELLASNEELQSTNEELQSTNEELFTVNAEYHSKIIELTELHNDVENLLKVTRVGKLILDENLEIRRFSEQTATIFKLLDADIGRPITHIPHYLVGEDPVEDIKRVQASAKEFSKEVRTTDGRWFLMRVLPYTIGPRVFSGTVLSFTDITEVKSAEAARRSLEQMFEAVADSVPVLVWMSGPDKKCFWFNKTWLGYTGRTMDQERGDGWASGVHPEDLDRCVATYVAAFDKREPFSMKYRLRSADGTHHWIEDVGTPRYDENSLFLGYVGSCVLIEGADDGR
jgi:two-component system CheB/CheR fusion protein